MAYLLQGKCAEKGLKRLFILNKKKNSTGTPSKQSYKNIFQMKCDSSKATDIHSQNSRFCCNLRLTQH